MGYSGYTLKISVQVDAHGGEREERGEKLYEEFKERLAALCDEYDNDAIRVMF